MSCVGLAWTCGRFRGSISGSRSKAPGCFPLYRPRAPAVVAGRIRALCSGRFRAPECERKAIVPPRLTACLVNFDSGPFALACVESLRADWQRSGWAPEDLEVIVVDNASPQDQEVALAGLRAVGAKVIRSPENLGYSGGVNLAYAASAGSTPRSPNDCVAILNADIIFMPGSVQALVDYVRSHERCGAVDARACIDPAGSLLLPINIIPTLTEQLWVAAARHFARYARSYAEKRRQLSVPYWSATGPLKVPMLSGCCLFMRREVVDELGSPLDSRYPLYFEDTDLFRQLEARGYDLIHHGGAPILHHWSRSAGVGGQGQGETLRRFRASRRIYFNKFFGLRGRLGLRLIDGLAKCMPKSRIAQPIHQIEDLGPVDAAPTLTFPKEVRYVLEFSPDPKWIVGMGILGHGHAWTPAQATWEWFFQTETFVRGFDLETGELLGAWRFQKMSPGRERPLSMSELGIVPAPAPLS